MLVRHLPSQTIPILYSSMSPTILLLCLGHSTRASNQKLGKCLLVSFVHCWLTCLLASTHNGSVWLITRLWMTLISKSNLTIIHLLPLITPFSNRRTQSWDIVLSSRFSQWSSRWYGTLCWPRNGPITKRSRPWNRGRLASTLHKVGQDLWHTRSMWLLRRFHKDRGHQHLVRPAHFQLQQQAVALFCYGTRICQGGQ